MKIKGMEADGLLMLLDGITEGRQNPSVASVRKLLAAMYDQLTGKYGPIVQALPALSGPVSKDLTPMVCAIVDALSGVASSAEFKKSQEKFAAALAGIRMASLKAYEGAGFTREEAFYLVLKDASRKLAMPDSSSLSSKE